MEFFISVICIIVSGKDLLLSVPQFLASLAALRHLATFVKMWIFHYKVNPIWVMRGLLVAQWLDTYLQRAITATSSVQFKLQTFVACHTPLPMFPVCIPTVNELIMKAKCPPTLPKKKQKVGVALTGPASPTFKKTNNKKNYILKVCNFCIFLKYFPNVFQDIFLKVKESVELPHSNELRVLPVFQSVHSRSAEHENMSNSSAGKHINLAYAKNKVSFQENVLVCLQLVPKCIVLSTKIMRKLQTCIK